MQHRKIKRFQQKGVINDDSDFIRFRETIERTMDDEMRYGGYVPVLDLGPFWSTSLIDEHYDFVLTKYGIYVGKVKAWEILGIDGTGRSYQKMSTPKNKSSTS